MKLSDINEFLGLVANLGVLAGIIFVAIEISQNTEMMKSQTRATITQNQLIYLQEMSDPDKLGAAQRFVSGESNSSSAEARLDRGIFSTLQYMLFRSWENEYYQFSRGLFDEEEFIPRLNTWKTNLSNPNIRDVWKNMSGDGYSQDFVNVVNQLIVEIENGQED